MMILTFKILQLWNFCMQNNGVDFTSIFEFN